MSLLLTICSAIAIIFGIGVFFSMTRGAIIAGLISIGAGVLAYDRHSFIPLFVGFGLLWVLRIMGLEERK